MNFISKIKKNNPMIVNMTASVIIHAALFLAFSILLYYTSVEEVQGSGFVQITTRSANPTDIQEDYKPLKDQQTEPALTEEENQIPEQKKEPVLKELLVKEPSLKESSQTGKVSLSNQKSDTSDLRNIYSETTLHVRIKYPKGWTFIDQNVKNKLDGVTFWSPESIYNPPPYIHLEVKEKYLFNASRYKFKEEMEDYTAYYNEPKEMEGQVSQEIYLVTETDEDYSIKLIMEGTDAFYSFQPVFLGMLKTFRFGRNLF